MPKFVQITLVAVTDQMGYVDALKQAEKLAQKEGVFVADLPMVIRAMTNHPDVRKAIRSRMSGTSGWVDTITGEYHGQRDGDRSYEVWHSVGSLATAKGLKKAFPKAGDYGFMEIADDEWLAVGKGNYHGLDVPRIHLDDAKKGNVPAAGTSHTIFALLDKDRPNINPSDVLTYSDFMRDDRVLMITGSPDNREKLAKLLFGTKKEGGECYKIFGSYHRIYHASFDTKAKGRLVHLDYISLALGGDKFVHNGRFAAVSPGTVCTLGPQYQSR